MKDVLRHVWDLLTEGYWQSVAAIGRHPQIVFWVLLGLAIAAFV